MPPRRSKKAPFGRCDECRGPLDDEGHCPSCDYGFDEGVPQPGYIPPAKKSNP